MHFPTYSYISHLSNKKVENMFTGDDGKGGKGKERAEVCVLLFIHKFFIKVSKRLGICSLRMT